MQHRHNMPVFFFRFGEIAKKRFFLKNCLKKVRRFAAKIAKNLRKMLKFLLKSTKICDFWAKINDFLAKIANNDFSFFRGEKMLKKIAKKRKVLKNC